MKSGKIFFSSPDLWRGSIYLGLSYFDLKIWLKFLGMPNSSSTDPLVSFRLMKRFSFAGGEHTW
jgi:hypothetical protein